MSKTKRPLPLSISIPVSYEAIASAMCSALESTYGSRYWCGGEFESPQSEEYDFWYADEAFWARADFEATFRHDTGRSLEGSFNVKTTIHHEDLVKGLTLMAEKNPYQFGQLVSMEGDATTGDVLMQFVLLKKEVFG